VVVLRSISDVVTELCALSRQDRLIDADKAEV
jgi:hypothetical protein